MEMISYFSRLLSVSRRQIFSSNIPITHCFHIISFSETMTAVTEVNLHVYPNLLVNNQAFITFFAIIPFPQYLKIV